MTVNSPVLTGSFTFSTYSVFLLLYSPIWQFQTFSILFKFLLYFSLPFSKWHYLLMQREDILQEKKSPQFSALNLRNQVHEPTFSPSFLPHQRSSATTNALSSSPLTFAGTCSIFSLLYLQSQSLYQHSLNSISIMSFKQRSSILKKKKFSNFMWPFSFLSICPYSILLPNHLKRYLPLLFHYFSFY